MKCEWWLAPSRPTDPLGWVDCVGGGMRYVLLVDGNLCSDEGSVGADSFCWWSFRVSVSVSVCVLVRCVSVHAVCGEEAGGTYAAF